ncbi:MAG: protein translocase subunit SecD [Bacteroidales bacterium]
MRVLTEETESAIDNAFNILRSRIDRFGVTQPNISRLEARGRILVELPGVKDPERVRELLQGTAKLEIWETYENSDVLNYLIQANSLIQSIEEDIKASQAPAVAEAAQPVTETADEVARDTTGGSSLLDMIADSTGTDEPASLDEFKLRNPLFGILRPSTYQDGTPSPGSVIGYSHYRDTSKVMDYLRMNQVRAIFPRDIKFFWSSDPWKFDETNSTYELHAIRVTTRDGRAPLDGDVITSARVSYGQSGGSPKVDMTMNAEGAKTWARLTRENTGKFIAVVLDSYVRSSARVSGEIKGGNTEITGDFSLEEAEDLANILKSGKLPAPARVIQDTVVGPTLGKEAIQAGLNSFLIAFVLVLAYMIFYYSRRAGLVADLALVVNMFFIMGVLASLGAVLTLPGIAGIVLTIGMSVDANVLIYERIKEELKGGKGVKLAVADGYKNAYSAIIDANVTTLLTGVVLYVFGTGPIKGFATTLVIGIVTSLFSAIFITRLIYENYLKRNAILTFSNRWTENAFKNTNIDFIGKRKIFYAISSLIILAGIASLAFKGLNYGIDFQGAGHM